MQTKLHKLALNPSELAARVVTGAYVKNLDQFHAPRKNPKMGASDTPVAARPAGTRAARRVPLAVWHGQMYKPGDDGHLKRSQSLR